MEGVKREISVLFEFGLSRLEHHLEDTITTLVGKVTKVDQPSSSSIHHKTIPPRREIPQEEIDHDHYPNHEQLLSPPKRSGYQMKPKLELSKFNGDTKKSMAWINKAEELFSIHNIIVDEEMVKYASMQLEDQAYNWYMWWRVTKQKTKRNWKTFKNDFFKRFEDLKEKYFFAKLTRLLQKDTEQNLKTSSDENTTFCSDQC